MEKEYQNAMIIFDDGKCGFADLTNVTRNGTRVTGGFSQPKGFKSLEGKRIEGILLKYDIRKGAQDLNNEDLL
jgi:hypothetical protein